MEPKRLVSMDIAEAREGCGMPFSQSKTQCPVCKFNVIIHCQTCQVQVTGCKCTAKERMSPEEYKEFERQQALVQLRLRGFDV